MSRKRLVAVLAIVVAAAAGYAWAKVISDHDPNADFSSYKTYGWLQREDADDEQLPAHLRMRLQRVTEEVLAERDHRVDAIVLSLRRI